MARERTSRYTTTFLLSISLLITSCREQTGETQLYETENFKSYWHAGTAELNAYNLSQSHYGENREGKAVLIFVTEDFSKKKQVKLDDPNSTSNKVNVLKLNFTKNFITGIYPYSMMLSVFTPISRNKYPATLKATMSVQEWCGHVFTQLNLKGNHYQIKSYSYFEQESDERFTIMKKLLEDEVWNIIRINPNDLPLGNIQVIPGLFSTRMNHQDVKPQMATASVQLNGDEQVYTLDFVGEQRKLAIRFEREFPHKILGWEEEFLAFEKIQKTSASLDKTMNLDYWTKNKTEFEFLRDSLRLSLPH